MFNASNQETFWLNVTNISLGVVTLVCCAILAYAIYQEVRVKMRKRATEQLPLDDHAFLIPKLGFTMADGGERSEGVTENQKQEFKHNPLGDEDKPNIIRP